MQERPLRCDARRNRDRLLVVAAETFADRGVETSLEEIAKNAGVGIGTLYRHFPTRDALVEAVYRREVEQLCDTATELLATMPPDRALAEWMRAFVIYVSAKRGLATALKSIVTADSELFTYTHQRIRSAMDSLVAAARADGSIRPDADAGDVMRAMSGICLAGDQPGWQDQACRITTLLMDGLRFGAPAGVHAS